jgi:hypothetical protein
MTKMEKWNKPSYFRGFNTSHWSNVTSSNLTLKDFQDMRSAGANLAIIQTEGFMKVDPPYEANNLFHYTELDAISKFCNEAGISYVISLRSGPGRRDVAAEEAGGKPSTLWTNKQEQLMYAVMLKDLVKRYKDDTCFAGLDMVMEPDPLYKTMYEVSVSSFDSLMKSNNIDINAMYKFFIEEVRKVDSEIPLLVQGTAWSNPEYFRFTLKQQDEKIVYNVHIYTPYEFSHSEPENSRSYPGTYENIISGKAYYDKNFLRNNVFSEVRKFQVENNVPVLMGEFGLKLPQNGGIQYLNDISSIAKEYGWHYALWIFRTDLTFNYERMGKEYWNTVLGILK